MSLGTKEIYEFGHYRLDVDERVIERIDGIRNGALPDKAFDVLVQLVRTRGHLVSKDDLLQHVWPDTIVEENNLEKQVHRLRQFFGESKGAATYIETVRRHGYRFTADVNKIEVSHSWLPETLRPRGENWHSPKEVAVEETAASNGVPDSLNALPPSLSAKRDRVFGRRVPAVVGLVVLLGVLSFLAYFAIIRRDFVPTGERAIAVLPVKPIDQASRNELYEVGIAESLIHRITAIDGFVVRPISATRGYTGLNIDPVAAGREQKVDYVLDANYQIADGKIKVTTQLINIVTGKVEDAYQHLSDITTVFELQDAVASDIGRRLASRFGSTTIGSAAKRGTSSEEAYRLYQQGMNLIERRGAKAIDYFDQAIGLDPNYASAYAGKARAHKLLGTQGGLDREEFEKAWDAAKRALVLNSGLAEGYAARGELQYKFQRDFAAAERDFLRAIELEPKNANVLYLYGEFLGHDKRFDESIREIDNALEIDPNSLLIQRDRGRILYFARRYDEAITQLKRVIEMDANTRNTHMWLWFAYVMKGDQETAYEWLLRWREQVPEDISVYQTAYSSDGLAGAMRKLLAPEAAMGPYLRARIHSLLNQKDEAFADLERSLERDQSTISMVYADPVFDNLRGDPRYEDIVRRIRKE